MEMLQISVVGVEGGNKVSPQSILLFRQMYDCTLKDEVIDNAEKREKWIRTIRVHNNILLSTFFANSHCLQLNDE